MANLRQIIRDIHTGEQTYHQNLGLLKSLLSILSFLYRGANWLHREGYRRRWRPIRRLACPVISIGNLIAGGTGKTPMTQYIARLAQRRGLRIVVLSRGYGGKAEKKGGIVSDGSRILMDSQSAGDEPFMLAFTVRDVPVLVGRDRYRSGCLAVDQFSPDMIILDDGFQHIGLARDLDLLLLDGEIPLGNGHLLPRGMLREPPAGIKRADAIILTRSNNETTLPDGIGEYLGTAPLFRAFHQPVIVDVVSAGEVSELNVPVSAKIPQTLNGRRVFAFSGIAVNKDFIQSIDKLKGEVVGQKGYSDHYYYDRNDYRVIDQTTAASRADCLATTAKDFARMKRINPFSLELVVVDVEMGFYGEVFEAFLSDALDRLLRS